MLLRIATAGLSAGPAFEHKLSDSAKAPALIYTLQVRERTAAAREFINYSQIKEITTQEPYPCPVLLVLIP